MREDGQTKGRGEGDEGLRLRLSLESVRRALVLRNNDNDARRKSLGRGVAALSELVVGTHTWTCAASRPAARAGLTPTTGGQNGAGDHSGKRG